MANQFQAESLSIPDLRLLTPQVFGDDRGFFFESHNKRRFDELLGRSISFVQDNHSRSTQNTLRGIHYQINNPQGKLVRVIQGEVYDVAVDLRQSSPTFGRWVGETLSAENKKQLWIPEGFGHGFLVLSPTAEFLYKTTDYYAPEHERCIRWDDSTLNIKWPLRGTPILSKKDTEGLSFPNAPKFP